MLKVKYLIRRIKIKFNIASLFLKKIYVSEPIGIEPFFICENAAETTGPNPLVTLPIRSDVNFDKWQFHTKFLRNTILLFSRIPYKIPISVLIPTNEYYNYLSEY